MAEQTMRERIARALYERGPMFEQPTDLDGRPIGPEGPLTYDQVVESHPKLESEFLADADAVLDALREDDLRLLLAHRQFQAKTTRTADNTCHVWTGPIDRRDGYGRFYVGGKTIGAHQFAYRWQYGEVPAGLVIDHVCRNRACVNPAHLRAVTNAENVLAGEGITAARARSPTCGKGHDLTGENAYIRREGTRSCRICQNERSKNSKARKRQAMIDSIKGEESDG